MRPISVDEILRRVPERGCAAYTNLVTHPRTVYDDMTGWSYAYISQRDLAREMGVAARTAQRALVDLREVGLIRVLAWPGAETETHVRVADVDAASAFGPVRAMHDALPRPQQVDLAIEHLKHTFDFLDGRDGATDASSGESSARTRAGSSSSSNSSSKKLGS